MSPQGLGLRQSSGAFDDPRHSKRQRPAALQDAGALVKAITRFSANSFAIVLLVALVTPSNSSAQDEPPKKTFFLPKSATAAAYVLGRLSNQELIEAPRSEFVYVALLQRKGLERKYRVEALEGLAKVRNTDALTELLAGIGELDKKGEASEAVLRDLLPLLLQAKAEELKSKGAKLDELAKDAQLPLTRQIAHVALVTGAGAVEPVWNNTQANPAELADLIRSVELIRNPMLRAAFYPKVEPLLHKDDAPELRKAAIAAVVLIPGHEADTFKTLVAFVQQGTEKSTALASLPRIPKATWPKDNVKPLLDAILVDLEKAPAEHRSEPDYVNAVQFAKDLASFLPAEQAAAINKTLRGLGSSVFLLRTLPERMLYDQTLLVVEAGKAMEIILQNDDAMPHNVVVVKAGADEEVGNAAEKMTPTPDARGRAYVPELASVLHASTLVEPGQRAKLAFTAPEETGEYPYICTYPGHWRLMRGTLAVVKDVEEYLANRAATAPTITEWKVDDLKADLAAVSSGRNLVRGRELYTKLACASCHKLGGEGVNYGPDLSDLLKRFNKDRVEILRQILEPSLVISNRYRNVAFNLKDGEEATGIIIKEDAASVTFQSGPSDSLIQTLAKSDIADQKPKDLSPMPMGLLNPLAKEEILDLLGWIESGGHAAHTHQY